jgi:hypothetical protein
MPMMTRIAGALALSAVTGMAIADEWSVEPYVSARENYYSNYRYLSSNHDPIWESVLTPGFAATEASPNTSLKWSGNISGVHNSDNDPVNSVYGATNLSFLYTQERSTFGLDLRYYRATTLASDLTTLGVSSSLATLNSYSIVPSYTRTLSERLTGKISATGTLGRYSETGANGLSNYNYENVTPSLIYSLSPRTDLIGTLGAAWYDSAQTDSRSTTYSGTIGISSKYSETFSVNANVGYAHTTNNVGTVFECLIPVSLGAGSVADLLFPNQECQALGVALTGVNGGSTSGSNPIYTLGLVWDWTPRTKVNVTATEAVVPSGYGTALNNRYLTASLTQGFTDRLTGSVTGGYATRRQ